MITENLLVRTKDNHVMVFSITFSNAAERLRLKTECENMCQALQKGERFVGSNLAKGIRYDEVNTDFLSSEITGYHHRKDRANFVNNMKTDAPEQKNTLSFSYQFADDDFPEVIKNLGYGIYPRDKTFEVRYDKTEGEFVAQNFDSRTASVNSAERRIEIVRNHFRFLPEDYRRLQQLKNDFADKKRRNHKLKQSQYMQSLSNAKDKALFNFYARKKRRVANRFTTLAHELKHIKNAVLEDGLSLKTNHKRLSTENYYRISVEDERSAYLKELVNNVNAYLQKGDYDDFSMFYINNADIVENLRNLPTAAERKAYVQNWPQLVATKMQTFEKEHRQMYDYGPQNASPDEDIKDEDGDSKLRQFLQVTKERINQAPLSAPYDENDEEFRKLRSLFYNFQIYNPDKRKKESVDLSRYITPDLEVSIDDRIRREIIEPQQNRLNKRMRIFAEQAAAGTINTSLVEPAKALMRGAVVNSMFVNEIDNFRISSLYGPEVSAPSALVPPANDKADWSNNLQDYWGSVEGYREISKNNKEYRFKIKDSTVCYTSLKDVQVSKNADYEVYVKLLKEPATQSAPIEFLNTLSKEQALKLYIACINAGRKPIGAVPTDLSEIKKLKGIPPEDINKFNHRMQQLTPASHSAAKESSAPLPRVGRAQNTR